MREVVAFRANRIVGREQGYLDRVDTLSGLDRSRVAVVQRVTTRCGAYGCELGSLASELADHDEDARVALARHFASWEALLVAALERMRDKHVLRDEDDPRALATGIMASLQGGYLVVTVAPAPIVSRPDPARPTSRGSVFLDVLRTTDHKTIGKMYLVTSFGFFLAGGLMALLMRGELARPGLQFLSLEQYNQLFTMHGTIMLLLFATPMVFAFANLVLPLQIGAPDVSFPA